MHLTTFVKAKIIVYYEDNVSIREIARRLQISVCLIFTGGSWSVWLVTREGSWGWLADSFTMYFRMALVHLGLPGWQAAFANLPLIPWAEQLFLLLAPHLLEKVDSDTTSVVVANEPGLNHIDPNIFKTSARHHKSSRPPNQ